MINTNTISESHSLRSVIKITGMKTLGARIKHYRTLKGLSQVALAKACGWGSQSRIGNYETDAREPTFEDVKDIAKALGVTPEALLIGDGYFGEVGSNVSDAPQPYRAPRKYPLISWVEAGEMTESPSRIGEAHQWLESTETAGDGAYWLSVSGHSMTSTGNPNFPEGSLILVKPDAEIINGKYYVVEMLDSGEKTFKQYVEDAGFRYLRPLNDKYRTIEIDNNCRFLGRVVDTKMTGL